MNLSLLSRRARLLAVSVTAVALLLAASCSNGDDDSSASPAPTQAAETIQPAETSPTTTTAGDGDMGDGEMDDSAMTDGDMDDADDMADDAMIDGDMADDEMSDAMTDGDMDDADDMEMLDPIGALAEVRPLDDGSLQVYSEIVIAATPEQIWEVLTDFETMPEWSGSFQGLAGNLTDGGEAVATFLAEGELYPFPHALTWEEGRSFGWSDPLAFAPGIIDDHHYIIDRTDGTNTLFIQIDTLTGDNDAYPAAVLADQLVQGYAWFNQQLKAEVERRIAEGDDVAMLDPIGALAEVRPLDDGSLQVYSEIVIAATPEQIWEVLTDFETMPEWSGSFQGLAGDLTDGGEAVATFLAEGQAFPFPHVLSWEEGRSFGWSDPLAFAPGIVDDHHYIIDRTDGTNTLFIQIDTLTGDDAGYPAAVLADQLVQGYAWFNQQLKTEVERRF